MMSEKNVSDIALIEAHDARVEALVLPMNGSCEVRFKHLPVYRSRGNERFAIWSYRAVLELRRVKRIAVDETFIDADYVSDAVVHKGSEEISWLRLLETQVVTSVTMTFGSGRRIEIDCGEAQLALHEAVREVEEWRGPLVQQT